MKLYGIMQELIVRFNLQIEANLHTRTIVAEPAIDASSRYI